MTSTNIKTLIHDSKSHTLSLTTHPAPLTAVPSEPEFHLLKVQTTALTNGELLWSELSSLEYPVPGFDVAGTVVSAPVESRFKAGDDVYALTSFSRAGAAREQQVALESELALKPRSLSWEDAATVPLSALTAWQALFVHGGLEDISEAIVASSEKKRVLVTAASGGVGVWAVQLAKRAGAFVVAVCGPKNVGLSKELGADEVLDYTKTALSDWVGQDESRKFDVVIDCKGGDTLTDAWKAVKPNGFLDSVAMPAETKKPSDGIADGVRSHWFIVEPNGQQLAHITDLIDSKKCKAVLDSVWKLDDWEKAFERVDSGHARGKVVLKVAE